MIDPNTNISISRCRAARNIRTAGNADVNHIRTQRGIRLILKNRIGHEKTKQNKINKDL
jgi:hypothetical protein